MPAIFDRLTTKKAKDIAVLADFTEIFCRENHKGNEKSPFTIKEGRLQSLNEKGIPLCQDCTRLLNHGIAKLLQCTQEPKPMCKKCKIHCYSPEYRAKMKEVMKFSGLYLVKHGRIDMILHYYF